jgi:hypothetical protein
MCRFVPGEKVEVFLRSHSGDRAARNEDETGTRWGAGLAREWSAELSDSREDVYTLEDGQPLNATW